MDSFIVVSGDTARFSYIMDYDDSLRIIVATKSITTDKNLFITGKPAKETLKSSCREDIKKLELPAFYEKKFIKQVDEDYCYVIEPYERSTITGVYDIGEIKNCTLISVPISRHIIKPPSGGASVMVYPS